MNSIVHPFSKIAMVAAVLTWVVFSAHAQTYPEQYLQQALENNPGLQAQHKAWEAAHQQVVITGALPDPTLSAGFFTPPMERFMGNQWFDVGVMQMFPWPGTLGKQKSASEKMAESQYHQFRDERNRLFMEMTRLWLEIYRKEQALNILERNKQILKAREDIIYTRYEGGQQRSGLTLDIYRLEIQLAALENREEKIGEEHRALVESFNILVGKVPDEVIETPDTLTVLAPGNFDTQPSAESFAANPQFNSTQAAAEAAAIQQEVSRLKTRPMLGVGLQYSYLAPGEAAMGQMDGGHMLMPMVSVSLPIFGRKNQATQQQSQLLAEAAQFRQDNRVNMLQTQWTQLLAKLNNLQRDRRFFEQQIDITQKTWELVTTAYASGDEGFDELLRIQDQLLELEWRILENLVNMHLTRAEMDMLLAQNIFE
ncbi:MAG: TolC family protein [Bacteroidales bacterium]|nr:TolC family protein [Bacteroidales bacterium]